MKLSLDEKENLQQLFTHSGWKPFLTLLESALKRQQESVLKYNLDDGPEKLVIAKARAEGAKNFMEAVVKFRDQEVKGK